MSISLQAIGSYKTKNNMNTINTHIPMLDQFWLLSMRYFWTFVADLKQAAGEKKGDVT